MNPVFPSSSGGIEKNKSSSSGLFDSHLGRLLWSGVDVRGFRSGDKLVVR